MLAKNKQVVTNRQAAFKSLRSSREETLRLTRGAFEAYERNTWGLREEHLEA